MDFNWTAVKMMLISSLAMMLFAIWAIVIGMWIASDSKIKRIIGITSVVLLIVGACIAVGLQ